MIRIGNPTQGAEFFRNRMSVEVEEVWAAALNTGMRVTAAQCLFRGTVDQCLVHPRDIFRFACLHNAAAVLVAHNHPSGRTVPSPEDHEWTGRLAAAANLMMIPLMDHLIIGRRGHYSFLQSGLLVKMDGGFGSYADKMPEESDQK